MTIAEAVKKVNIASDKIEAKGIEVIKEPNFSQVLLGGHNLYIIHAESGEIVYFPHKVQTDDAEALAIKEINGKPFSRLVENNGSHSNIGVWWNLVSDTLMMHPHKYYSRAVSAPNGENYVLSASNNNVKMERVFIETLVTDAVMLFELTGEKAFDTFKDPDSYFRYKDTYVFVIDMEGTLLCDPGMPSMEHNPLFMKKFGDGVQKEIDIVNSESGEGWFFYHFYEPTEEDKIEPKWYFTKRATRKGKKYIVGSGIYPADIKDASRLIKDTVTEK
ncbi:cache domain-containing protein [Rubellicoccus peritrichatus]|uniref:Cache domain-containing protein n=1 Tax=Rubellicoccus peritrichatus TaxID=3080537 RepID=A0AAQ3QWU7_9BACT|nr:cache domain-containing protein [Puniceicoccus sp. CR14]WOO42272.1 cache domain-containing protein [Puniceicoccus sp. CR14]